MPILGWYLINTASSLTALKGYQVNIIIKTQKYWRGDTTQAHDRSMASGILPPSFLSSTTPQSPSIKPNPAKNS